MAFPMLDGVPQAERQLVLKQAVRRTYRRREVVFHHGDLADTLHLVASGRLSVEVTTPLGDTAILAIVGEGDVIGELALVSDHGRRNATCTALEPTETLVLHRSAFDRLREGHPSVDRFLVHVLSERARQLDDRLVEALFLPVEARVHRRLAELAEIYAVPDGRASIRLTQDEIAALSGTTRPTVNQVLRDAERAGVLTLLRGRIDVADRPALERLAGKGRTGPIIPG